MQRMVSRLAAGHGHRRMLRLVWIFIREGGTPMPDPPTAQVQPECPYCASQDLVEVENGAYVCQDCLELIEAEDVVWVGDADA